MNLPTFYEQFHKELTAMKPSLNDDMYAYYLNHVVKIIEKYVKSRSDDIDGLHRELLSTEADNFPLSCHHELVLWLYFNHRDDKYDNLYITTCYVYFPALQYTWSRDKFLSLMCDVFNKSVSPYSIPPDNIFATFSNFTWAKFDKKYFHITKLPDEIDEKKVGILTIFINYKNFTKGSNYSYDTYKIEREKDVKLINKDLIDSYKSQFCQQEFDSTREKFSWMSQNQNHHLIEIYYFANEFTLCINNIQESQHYGTLFFTTDDIVNILAGRVKCNKLLNLDAYLIITQKVQLYFFKKLTNLDKDQGEDPPTAPIGVLTGNPMEDSVKIRNLVSLFDTSNKIKSLEKIYNEVYKDSKHMAFAFFALCKGESLVSALDKRAIYLMLCKIYNYKF